MTTHSHCAKRETVARFRSKPGRSYEKEEL